MRRGRSIHRVRCGWGSGRFARGGLAGIVSPMNSGSGRAVDVADEGLALGSVSGLHALPRGARYELSGMAGGPAPSQTATGVAVSSDSATSSPPNFPNDHRGRQNDASGCFNLSARCRQTPVSQQAVTRKLRAELSRRRRWLRLRPPHSPRSQLVSRRPLGPAHHLARFEQDQDGCGRLGRVLR